MMAPDISTIDTATHVVFDMATAQRLSKIGATSIVRVSDRLIIGPSHSDPAEHDRARAAWWRAPAGEKWDYLYSSEVRWHPPIVLWVSTAIHERVNLWRTMSWLRHLGIQDRDVFILEFEKAPSSRAPEQPAAVFDCAAAVADHPDEALLETLANARPWPRARYDRAVSLWRSYVDASPLLFARSCNRGLKGFPELGPLWALLSSFFPRKARDGVLHLSRFDYLLLSILSTEPQTPLSVFVHKSKFGLDLRQILSCTGDLFLPERLEQWVRHGASAALERVIGPKPENPMKSFAYRITEAGLRLRESGLDGLADAPSLPIAGTAVYAPSAPWVLLEDGRLDRLTR